jgi:sugar-specific transcriptional regulator TrmB
MFIREEYISVLTELGLTYLQAKIYLTIVSIGNATAKTIFKYAKIARQDIYRILTELEERGLVERTITKPLVFKPLPINSAIQILLQEKEEELKHLRKKAFRNLGNLEADCSKMITLEGDNQFKILSKHQVNPSSIVYKIGDAVNRAQKSVMCLTTFKIFNKIKYIEEQSWKQAVKRGVKFKFIVCGCKSNEIEQTLDQVLKNSDNFKIETLDIEPPTCIILIDEKEVFCRLGVTIESPVLWSASSNFVEMIRDYFEIKWDALNNGAKKP